GSAVASALWFPSWNRSGSFHRTRTTGAKAVPCCPKRSDGDALRTAADAVRWQPEEERLGCLTDGVRDGEAARRGRNEWSVQRHAKCNRSRDELRAGVESARRLKAELPRAVGWGLDDAIGRIEDALAAGIEPAHGQLSLHGARGEGR